MLKQKITNSYQDIDTSKYGTNFPHNITLTDVRAATSGRSEFRELTFDDFIIVDYLIQKNDSFPDPNTAPDSLTRWHWQLRRECRGLAFSKETGKVISRRFHKYDDTILNHQ